MNDLLYKRDIKLKSLNWVKFFNSNNKTIIEYALEYVIIMQCNQDVLYQLKYVRMKKEVVYPFELVGFKGNQRTSCYTNINEKEPVRWKIEKNIKTELVKNQK